MGKSKRKRKLKEEDFKKKKLKVGKRLPMPDNVTKTSFKARTINIVQSTANQDGGGEPRNFKRQNLKDLLGSCSHYNSQAREEALFGLKDLIERHRDVLKDNLADILQNILGRITDIENSVRRSLLLLIRSVFSVLSEAEITPFFPSVVAYLCSAMTHLNESIRMDSLKLLDHCLHSYPRLLSAHSKNIILNFMDVISSEKVSQGSSKNAGISKALSLKAKVTSQKTQLQVLTRLNRLLDVIFSVYHDGVGGISGGGDNDGGNDGDNDGTSGNAGVGGSTVVGSCASGGTSVGGSGGIVIPLRAGTNLDGTNTTKNVKSVSSTMYGTLPGTLFTRETSLVSDFSLKSAWGGSTSLNTSTADVLGNEVKLMEFIASLSPVLFEYWIECCPGEFAVDLIPVSSKSTSLQIMKEVLEIFVTLIGSLEKTISNQEEFLKFLKEMLFCQFYNHFVPVFPMSFTLLQNTGSRKGRKEEINLGISDICLNLLMCKLFCYFIPDAKKDDGGFPKWAMEVVHYLSKVLLTKARGNSSSLTSKDIKPLTKLVKVLVLNVPNSSDNLKVKLLKNVHHLFEATHAMSNTKKVLLKFLEDVLQSSACHEGVSELKTILDIWLCSLVKLIDNKDLPPAFVHNVFLVCKLGIIHNFPNIGSSVSGALASIFRMETFERFSEETQLLVVEILYHLKQALSKQLFEVLSGLCNSGSLSLVVFQYLLQVVHQLCNPDEASQVSVPVTSTYLSFMLSLVVGQSQENLTSLQTQNESLDCFCHPVTQDNTLVTDLKNIDSFLKEGEQNVETVTKAWQYQKSVNSIVCRCLMLTDYSAMITEMVAPPLTKLFEKYAILPLTVVYRLLHLARTLLLLVESRDVEVHGQRNHFDLLEHLAKWCAVIWHFVISIKASSQHGEFFQVIEEDLKDVMAELCKASCDISQKLLDLFQVYTSSSADNCTSTCLVVTEMLKRSILRDLNHDCKSSLRSIHRNLEGAFNAGMVESQIFSDFKYQSANVV